MKRKRRDTLESLRDILLACESPVIKTTIMRITGIGNYSFNDYLPFLIERGLVFRSNPNLDFASNSKYKRHRKAKNNTRIGYQYECTSKGKLFIDIVEALYTFLHGEMQSDNLELLQRTLQKVVKMVEYENKPACDICGKHFKNEKGIKVHKARMHESFVLAEEYL